MLILTIRCKPSTKINTQPANSKSSATSGMQTPIKPFQFGQLWVGHTLGEYGFSHSSVCGVLVCCVVTPPPPLGGSRIDRARCSFKVPVLLYHENR